MTEHTVSAYCLLWVNVVQGSGRAPLGGAQCSVVNLLANNDTLFSTSPCGVRKSSCWFQVSVPQRPRTLWLKTKMNIKSAGFVASIGLGTQTDKSNNKGGGKEVTLFAKPGCRVMRAKGPSKCHSSWAPKAWMRRNEEETLRTTRSPVMTGSGSLRPFSITVPGRNNNDKQSGGGKPPQYRIASQWIK